jgi:hypothetical protein
MESRKKQRCQKINEDLGALRSGIDNKKRIPYGIKKKTAMPENK